MRTRRARDGSRPARRIGAMVESMAWADVVAAVVKAMMPVIVVGWILLGTVAPAGWFASWLVALPILIGAAIVVPGGRRSRTRYVSYGVVSASFAVWMLFDERWRIDEFHVRSALWTCGEALIVLAFIATRLAR